MKGIAVVPNFGLVKENVFLGQVVSDIRCIQIQVGPAKDVRRGG